MKARFKWQTSTNCPSALVNDALLVHHRAVPAFDGDALLNGATIWRIHVLETVVRQR